MSTQSQIYQFEANLTKATAAAIKAIGIPTVVRDMDDARVTTPYVMVSAANFIQASGQMAWAGGNPANRVPFYNHFSGTLTVTIVTTRNPDGSGQATQDTYRGQITALFARPRGGVRFLGYDILSVNATGSNSSQDDRQQQDRTELTFAVELAIDGAAMNLETA